MKREKINAVLHALGSKPTGYRSGWVEAPCVLAQWRHAGGKDAHPSFGIKVANTKKSICKCLSCGFGGDLLDLMFRVKELHHQFPNPKIDLQLAATLVTEELDDLEFDPSLIPEYDSTEVSEVVEVEFPDSWLRSFQPYNKFPDAIAYLDKRSVSAEVARRLDLRYDPIQRRIGFPYRNFKGKIMGVQGRSINPEEELRYYQYGYNKHRNSHVWMGEDRLDLDKPLVLLEGPFDLASVFRVYQNVAASFTSGLSVNKVKRVADAVSIITLYDHGSGGDSARAKIREVLKGVPIVDVVPTKEVGDAGAMSESQVVSALEGLVEFSYID